MKIRQKKALNSARNLLIGLLALGCGYISLLVYPYPLFHYKYSYKQFNIYSDRAIPIEIETVLDDVQACISKSELYSKSNVFKIFICNNRWRLALFTRNPNLGGAVNILISSNVFIRECNITNNQLISPIPSVPLLAANERPLSYFIAHEIVHALQRKIDRFMPITTRHYIIEGYADYIAKAPNFDFKCYFNDFYSNNWTMDPKMGLYNRYHLVIAYLMERKGMTFWEIAMRNPQQKYVEGEMLVEMSKYIQSSL